MAKPPSFPYQIESERLILRCYDLDDAVRVFDAIAASREHLRPWMPFADSTLEDISAFVRRSRGKYDLMQDFVMGIFSKADGRYLGGTGLHRFDWDLGRFEIGYWLRANETGKGYVTESTWRLTSLAFETLEAQRIEIRIAPDNLASRAVPERLGFQLEGILRHSARHEEAFGDICLYSLIRPEYETHPRRANA